MRVDEILLIGDQEFPKSKVESYLKYPGCFQESSPFPYGPYDVFCCVEAHTVGMILVSHQGIQSNDSTKISSDRIAAYASFEHINLRGTFDVFRAKNAASYEPFKKNNLLAKLYKYVKVVLKKRIQSDIQQTTSGKKLWTNNLPKEGLFPKIFDSVEEYIIDETNPTEFKKAMNNMYTTDITNPERHRYTWVLEWDDHYPSQNILREHGLLMPYKGFWYDFKEEKKILESNNDTKQAIE